MDVRLFPDGRAFVRNHTIDIEPALGNEQGSFVIPLNREQVDMNSIQVQGINDVVYLTTRPTSIVTKDDTIYVGDLISYSDNNAVLSTGTTRRVIRNYDDITEAQYIGGRTATGVVPDTLAISYLTSGINGNVVHNLDIQTRQLESDLVVSNNTFNDLVSAQFEVITAEQVVQTRRYARVRSMSLMAENASPASSEESSAGTIYVVDGTYDVPSGYDVSIPLIRNDVDANIIYVINAPNGQANATYTLRWVAPADLPPGQLYVYRGGDLETTTNIPSTGEGQRRDIPLLVIPSVYARGTVTRTDSRPTPIILQGQNGNANRTVQVPIDDVIDERRTTVAEVRLNGTVTNSLNEQVTVYLRYDIGEGRVNIGNGTRVQRENNNLVFPLVIGPNTSQPYNFTFSITY